MAHPATADDNVAWEPDAERDLGRGTIETSSDDCDPDEHPVAVLWLRDPEQHSGYREYYVRRQRPKQPAARPMGFRKPGAA